MAKMRMLTSAAGDGFVWSEGEVVEVDEKTARVWCDGVRAERVRDEREKQGKRKLRRDVERAVTGPPENRAAPSVPDARPDSNEEAE